MFDKSVYFTYFLELIKVDSLTSGTQIKWWSCTQEFAKFDGYIVTGCIAVGGNPIATKRRYLVESFSSLIKLISASVVDLIRHLWVQISRLFVCSYHHRPFPTLLPSAVTVNKSASIYARGGCVSFWGWEGLVVLPITILWGGQPVRSVGLLLERTPLSSNTEREREREERHVDTRQGGLSARFSISVRWTQTQK